MRIRDFIDMEESFKLLFQSIPVQVHSLVQDFFLFHVMENIKSKGKVARMEAERMVTIFENLEKESHKKGSQYYRAFFYALAQILSLHHGITRVKDEDLSKEAFGKKWREMRRLWAPKNN